jgi:hypothetical protein
MHILDTTRRLQGNSVEEVLGFDPEGAAEWRGKGFTFGDADWSRDMNMDLTEAIQYRRWVDFELLMRQSNENKNEYHHHDCQ